MKNFKHEQKLNIIVFKVMEEGFQLVIFLRFKFTHIQNQVKHTVRIQREDANVPQHRRYQRAFIEFWLMQEG